MNTIAARLLLCECYERAHEAYAESNDTMVQISPADLLWLVDLAGESIDAKEHKQRGMSMLDAVVGGMHGIDDEELDIPQEVLDAIFSIDSDEPQEEPCDTSTKTPP